MISYRSTDWEFVKGLLDFLRNKGISPWVDREGIKPGTRWRDELFRQLQLCEACIIVLSKDYLKSEHCRMEVFIARSYGRVILPVILDDCFDTLSEYEETKGLQDIFMMRMFKLNAVGLPISKIDAFERIVDGVLAAKEAPLSTTNLVYVSYSGSRDGEFATDVAKKLHAHGIDTWVATVNTHVGENWRDAQARAMMRASYHVIVLDDEIIHSPILRTEILLSEARGLGTFTVLPPRLSGEEQKINQMMDDLRGSDQTYYRLTQTQYFTQDTLDQLHVLINNDQNT